MCLAPTRITDPGRLLTLLEDSMGSIGDLLNGEVLPGSEAKQRDNTAYAAFLPALVCMPDSQG